MSWGEEQKKEIETIRERKITVKPLALAVGSVNKKWIAEREDFINGTKEEN